MALMLDQDERFSASREFLKSLSSLQLFQMKIDPAYSKRAEKSYLETAHELGYQNTEAQQWASAVMWQLRIEEDRLKVRTLISPPTSPT